MVLVLFVFGLVFYALGIATDFFASPVFSAFFVVSYQTAHNFVTYIAFSMAVVLSAVGLCLVIVERRKTEPQVIGTEPVVAPLSSVMTGEEKQSAFLSADEFEKVEIGSGDWAISNGFNSLQETQQPNMFYDYNEQSPVLTTSEDKPGAQVTTENSANIKNDYSSSSVEPFSELRNPFLEVKWQAGVQNKQKTKLASTNVKRKKPTALPKKHRSTKPHS